MAKPDHVIAYDFPGLMPGLREANVKPQKNGATDAEAICEAVSRPNMRFVETKTSSSRAA